ncbi:MAG: hypothetical protein ACK4MT_09825, partial [Thermaurantiacus tibetensis]
ASPLAGLSVTQRPCTTPPGLLTRRRRHGRPPGGCAAGSSVRALGVTRLGLLTGLDRLGLPVAQAVPPLARAIGVHAGKGFDPTAGSWAARSPPLSRSSG